MAIALDLGSVIVRRVGVGCFAMKVKIKIIEVLLILIFLELNYCESNPETCKNGAKCVSLTKDDGNYKCLCREGTWGRNCEQSEFSTTVKTPTTTTAAAVNKTRQKTEPLLVDNET